MNVTDLNGKAQILIVDDHPVVRRGLIQLISDLEDMDVCGEASNKPDALAAIKRLHPDLALIDISLGDANGIDLVKEVRAQHLDTKMLILSMHDEMLFAERSIRAGAFGYVNKNEPNSVLITALHRTLNGEVHLSPQVTRKVISRGVTGRGTLIESPLNLLSDRELQVFEMIGEGMITKQIAAKLTLSVKTIETYRENIKTKLQLANSTELTREAVQWVLERG